MDKRLELVDALLTFGKQAERLAKLLSLETIGEIKEEPLITAMPDSNKIIDINQYQIWPEASLHRPDPLHQAQLNAVLIPPLTDLTVLEYSKGPTYPIAHYHQHAKIALITDDFKFQTQPDNVKIINSFTEAGANYDVGVVWESIEFSDNPALILMELKQRCKKIIIRFRPWTGRDGAFQSPYFNKAYAQLVMPLDHLVKFKVVRPLATYEALFAKAGLAIQERKINGSVLEEFFQTPDVLQVIIERTWGTIKREDAVRIMATDSVDYTVAP